MFHRSNTLLRTAVLALGLSILLAGCGTSDSEGAASSPSASTDSSPTPSATVPPAAAEMTAMTDNGDAVSVSVRIRTPTALADVETAQGICAGTLSDTEQERAVAIPIVLDVQVTSSMSTPVTVRLAEAAVVDSGTAHLSMDTDGWYWADRHSFGDSCERPGDYNSKAGTVHWTDIGAGHHAIFQTWLIVPDDISPNDPTGQAGKASRVVLSPEIGIGDAQAERTFAASPNVVTCTVGDPAAPGRPLIAVDPGAARAAGCTA